LANPDGEIGRSDQVEGKGQRHAQSQGHDKNP
jgi:hypothetical protein